MSVRSMLTQKCTIERWGTREANSDAELVPAYSSAATNVRCLIQEHRPRVMSDERGITLKFTVTGYYLPGEDIRPGQASDSDNPDRVILTLNGAGTYKVLGVVDQAGKGKLKTVALEGTN